MFKNFKVFFEGLESPSLIINSTGLIIEINEKARELTGLAGQEDTGISFNNIFTSVNGEENIFSGKPSRYLLKNNNSERFVFEVRSQKITDDSEVFYWLTLTPGENGLPGSNAFKTDRNNIQSSGNADHLPGNFSEEVEAIRDRYRMAVEASQTGVGDYNFEKNELIIDESLHELLGYTENPDSSINFWSEIIYPDDRQTAFDTIEQYIKENKTYIEITFRIRHQRRLYLWVLCRGKILYRHNEAIRMIFALTDITEKIERTELLDKALVNFKSVFDAFPDLFFRLNRLGDYLEVMAGNKSDLVWPDYDHYEGRNIREAFPDEVYHSFYKSLKQSFDTRDIESCFYSLTIGRQLKHFEARIKAISDSEAIVIVRNISEAVKKNQELEEARKVAEDALRAKDDFLSSISHEIRTPLNVVIGMTYLLLQSSPREDQLKYINTLKYSSTGLINMINDLLDLSKIRAGRFEVEHIGFNLIDFLNDLHESYSTQFDKRPVEFRMKVDESVPEHVFGDSKRLAQILNNLLSNAGKFTEKGYVSLEVTSTEEENIPGRVVEFTVSDTGIGIDPSRLDMVFEPYVQSDTDTYRKYGGTGLGLAIIKQLLEIQHGTISVESTPGEGSTFRVRLPMKIARKTEIPRDFQGEKSQNILKDKNLTILYADDVASNRFLMQGYFDLWGCSLETANDGQEALTKAERQEFDIILMDLQMPVLDGFRAATAIRKLNNKNKDCPIIAITGDVSVKTKTAILDAGFNDILVKPINPMQLYEMIIHSLLGEKPVRHIISSEQHQRERNPDMIISFQQVDMLYSGVPVQYQQLMEMLLKEYEGYKIEMVNALRKGYFDEFRQIRHCMTSNMKLFEMNRLKALADELRKHVEEYPDQKIPEETIKRMEVFFQEVIDSFSEKLKALISQ